MAFMCVTVHIRAVFTLERVQYRNNRVPIYTEEVARL